MTSDQDTAACPCYVPLYVPLRRMRMKDGACRDEEMALITPNPTCIWGKDCVYCFYFFVTSFFLLILEMSLMYYLMVKHGMGRVELLIITEYDNTSRMYGVL